MLFFFSLHYFFTICLHFFGFFHHPCIPMSCVTDHRTCIVVSHHGFWATDWIIFQINNSKKRVVTYGFVTPSIYFFNLFYLSIRGPSSVEADEGSEPWRLFVRQAPPENLQNFLAVSMFYKTSEIRENSTKWSTSMTCTLEAGLGILLK